MRGLVAIDQEARVNRFAGYVASVGLSNTLSDQQRELIYDVILDLEAFFNCNPNIPPEWTGREPYADLRLRPDSPLF